MSGPKKSGAKKIPSLGAARRACVRLRKRGGERESKASRFSARDGRACEALRKRGGEVPKWSKGTDCKSVGFGLRRFEPSPPHPTPRSGLRNAGPGRRAC